MEASSPLLSLHYGTSKTGKLFAEIPNWPSERELGENMSNKLCAAAACSFGKFPFKFGPSLKMLLERYFARRSTHKQRCLTIVCTSSDRSRFLFGTLRPPLVKGSIIVFALSLSVECDYVYVCERVRARTEERSFSANASLWRRRKSALLLSFLQSAQQRLVMCVCACVTKRTWLLVQASQCA